MANRMGRMKDNTMRVKLLPVGWCVLAVLLCAAPCGAQSQVKLQTDDPWDVDSDIYKDYGLIVWGTLNLNAGAEVGAVWVTSGGTLNMYPGANVLGAMYVDPGTTVNFHGGGVGYGIWLPPENPDTVVTVHGMDFMLQDGNGSEPYSVAGYFTPMEGNGSTLEGFYPSDIPGIPGDPIYLKFYGAVPIYLVSPASAVEEVAIDIKPGSETNPINLKSKGLVPVAVLTADGFVASAVNPQTVLLAGVAPLRWTMEDVDSDGDKDMLFHFKTEDLAKVLTEDSTEATLVGETTEGVSIQGTDKVQIVPSKPKK